jgi:branched-chain amino acid transport system ATP-binding protein
LSKQFGAFKAASDVTLAFPQGVRHALIGPNGAGKTTLINLLTGVLAPSSGDVFLGDERITALPQHRRVKLGMTRTFQINTLFAGLTVLESVVLAGKRAPSVCISVQAGCRFRCSFCQTGKLGYKRDLGRIKS